MKLIRLLSLDSIHGINPGNRCDLNQTTRKPLRDENPAGGKFTVERLIQSAISQSDHVACDVLMRAILWQIS